MQLVLPFTDEGLVEGLSLQELSQSLNGLRNCTAGGHLWQLPKISHATVLT
jgi:hypothetical protein